MKNIALFYYLAEIVKSSKNEWGGGRGVVKSNSRSPRKQSGVKMNN